MSEGTPDVAARNGKAFLVLGVVGAVVLFLLYNIFFGGEKDNIDKKPKQLVVAPKSFEPPPLPEAPAEPVIPPPSIVPPSIPEPMSIPDIKNVNPLNPEEDSARKAQELARLRSAMLIQDGAKGGVGSIFGGNTTTPTPPADPNSQFAASLANTKAERVEATSIGDMRRTIAQGRLIQATMESALNTDLPAPIRAIVSRDTYGEAGTKPLIPKGSRLIGSYNTAVSSGQTRVFVVWTRVIRPDGVDIMLGSPLVDGIGQAGIGGQVDSKFQEIFARSLLSSVMNIAVAIGSDKINGGNSTTTTTTTGSQTSGDGATTATTNALNRLGSVTDGFIQKFLSVAPTILVDQGTPVNVFVNKDLVFPEEAVGARIVN
jgi:type IV secretion system protein VirB10